MQVTLETTNEQEHKLIITVPSALFEKRIKKRLREAASRVRLKGYRQGKAPLKEVQRQLGKAIRGEVADDMMREYTPRALEREKLESAEIAGISIINLKPGGDLKFTVTVQVAPEIELGDFSKIVVRKPQAEITDEDVEQSVYDLRWRRAQFHEVQRPAREGDRVTISGVTIIDGKRIVEDGEQEIDILPDKYKRMGSVPLLAKFSNILTGVEPGEVLSLPSADFEELTGAASAEEEATLEVTVRKIEQADVPELNDDFVSSFYTEGVDVEEFRALVRDSMASELESSVDKQVKDQLIDALAAMHDIPLPDALVYEEVYQEKERFVQLMWDGERETDSDLSDDLSDEDYELFTRQVEDLPDEPFLEQAEKNVIFGLVLKAIINAYSLTPDETLVRQRIDMLAQESQSPEQVTRLFYNDERMIKTIESQVLEVHAIEHILAAATIVPIPCIYGEAISGSFTTPPDTAASGKTDAGGIV